MLRRSKGGTQVPKGTDTVLSWQAKRRTQARVLAAARSLDNLLEYRDFLISKLAERPDGTRPSRATLEYGKEIMVVKEAIAVKTGGYKYEAVG